MPAPIIVRRNVLHRGVAAAPPASSAMSIVIANAAKQYLTTTWAHAPTDPKKVTISYWVKFINTPANPTYLFTTATTGGVIFDHSCESTVHFLVKDDAGPVYSLQGNGVVIPPADANWHQICIQIDTTQATNRVILWLDGVDSGSTGTQPALNSDMGATANGIASYIGEVVYQVGSTSGIPDAKFAYVYLIDGQSLTPSSFATGTGAGTIHPISYAGSFGTNGFFLNGSGSSLADQSGSGTAPTWTSPNGITYSADLPT